MTEVVKKGILEAELELQRASEEKLLEEGMLRQIPVVGSVLNWLSPVQSSVKGRTFDLAAGSLDSTETMYSTKAQGGGASLQDPPSLLPQRLPGRLDPPLTEHQMIQSEHIVEESILMHAGTLSHSSQVRDCSGARGRIPR
uniref:Uncharacterized protein n=1 Tax=Oryzias latipes TaxID=8090 RepID=A0A3P9MES8_ORYLA